MRRPHLIILSCALLALGCSDLTAPSRLDGTWREESTIAGSGVEFTLATNGDAITGQGSWSGEACCSGTVTVAGTTTQGDVTLALSFVASDGRVPPFSETFTGRLSDANTLSGTIVTSTTSGSVVFTRIR